MKAWAFRTHGGPEVLECLEVAEPHVGPLDLLVAVRAFGLNPIDCKVRMGVGASGQPPPPPPESPRIPGWDGSGIVRAIGSLVEGFAPGDAVWWVGDITRPGCYAQRVAVDHRIASRIPRNLGFEDAASLPMGCLTAWECLFEQMQAGTLETGGALLVVGGAGGVGSAAIQIGRRVCGLDVAATASRPEAADHCRRLGARVVLDRTRPLASQLHEHRFPTPRLVLLAAEPSWLPALMDLVAPRGVVCGITGGSGLASLDVRPLVGKRATLTFGQVFERTRNQDDPYSQGRILSQVARLVEGEVILPTRTRTIPWERLPEAHAVLDAQTAIGKMVVPVPE